MNTRCDSQRDKNKSPGCAEEDPALDRLSRHSYRYYTSLSFCHQSLNVNSVIDDKTVSCVNTKVITVTLKTSPVTATLQCFGSDSSLVINHLFVCLFSKTTVCWVIWGLLTSHSPLLLLIWPASALPLPVHP